MVGIGLNWWQAIVVIFVSQLISSVAMYFNSRCASVYHIGYPVVARSVFGMYGSYYFVGARAALAIIWYGVQRKCSNSGFCRDKVFYIFKQRLSDWSPILPRV